MTSSEFATFLPDSTGRLGNLNQGLYKPNGAGGWALETVPFTALYDALGRVTSFAASGVAPKFKRVHTYSYDANGNRTADTLSLNGAAPVSYAHTVDAWANRQATAAGVTVVTSASGKATSLLGKTLSYDSAARLSQASAVPACPSGSGCAGMQTTTSRYNGWNQRYLRESPSEQTVFSSGLEGFNLLSETTRQLSTSALSTTEHIYLPTASGPMPVAAVVNGVHYAVHSDHLNTPRRLTDANKVAKWQWAYSAFGEVAPQSLPAAGQTALSYGLRYPGQLDDGNGLFYNWNRFYDPRVGRYTQDDPIGLDGGWNRFGYVNGNPLASIDPSDWLSSFRQR